MELRMSGSEAALFKSLLIKDQTYLEFGAGGSTFEAAKSGLREINCVETDPVWIEKVNSIIPKHDALNFHHVDLGRTREWGLPASDLPTDKWVSYYIDIWSRLNSRPDFVFIDGRFRTACGLMACLACPASTVIAVHDFYDPLPVRRNYQRLLEFFDVVDAADSLVVLRKKDLVNYFRVISVLADVRQDYW